jgi:phytoene desaturase
MFFMSKTAIIVGAGIGGMATAIRLALDGWSVKVLEKNVRVGGKLDCYSEKGFIWDVGPSLITMPFVLRELFESAGHDVEDYVDLIPVDPSSRFFFPDGKVINTWSNFHLFQIEVARRERDQGEALDAYMKYVRGVYEFAAETHLFEPPKNLFGWFAPRILKTLPHLGKVFTSQSMAEVIESYFKDPHVRQIFLRYATGQGSSPYRAPAAFNILSYMEMQGGAWYIRGGMYRLAEALENCARDLKVEFLVDAEVSQITLKGKGAFQKPRATGVLIRGGVPLEADVVICNADAIHVWSRLLHTKRQVAMTRQFDRKPFSSAPFMILWGVKRRYEQLSHQNIFVSSDYVAEFDDLFKKRRPAAEPSISLTISARTDPTQAPAGQDNYFVYVQTPPLEPDHHWDQLKTQYRDLIMEQLEKRGLEKLRDEILCERIITPTDFAHRNHAYRGAIYGHAGHSLSSVWNRPANRSEEVDGLYFVGGSAQPGGGVPFALLSAKRTAEAVKDDVV